ncbi:MAG TPA: acetate/propionate family kinase [Candidatus Binataceae bacterium]|nr:acetate/propionate family kinase [Candidatus Binataceae bacterium]
MANEQTILCLNVGSSSCKFSIFDRDDKLVLSGEAARIGLDGGSLTMRTADGRKTDQQRNFKGIAEALDALVDETQRATTLTADAVGHRVVHGGLNHAAPERITPELVADLKRLIPYDELHMPGAIAGIEAITKRMPEQPQVACFDTAFHRRMPLVAERFALPRALYDEGLRRYGFHGISYEYIMHSLGPNPPRRIIIAHLGNGASMAAIRDGVGIDTTMGFTPTGGFMMGTRSGDLDPGVLLYLLKVKEMNARELENLVDHHAGLLGVSDLSSDVKTLLEKRRAEPAADLAIKIFCYQIRKQIGAFAAALGGLDLLIFTAGIGERAPEIRSEVCAELEHLGIVLDAEKNGLNSDTISSIASRCIVRVIRTNENLMIARHTRALISTEGRS